MSKHLDPQDQYEDVSDEDGQCEGCGAADGDGHSNDCPNEYPDTRSDDAYEAAREARYGM